MVMPPPLPDELIASPPTEVQVYLRQLEAFAAHLAQRLSTQVAASTAQVVHLVAKLKQSSSNSSPPLSSDRPQHKRGVRRPSSQRKRGEQTRHSKHERVILPSDHIVDHKLSHCGRCDTSLADDHPHPFIDQVIEHPVKRRQVTHHRHDAPDYPLCQPQTTALPVPETAHGFGPRIQAATTYFSGVGRRLIKRTLASLFADLFDIPMALGSVSKFEARTILAVDRLQGETLSHTQTRDTNLDEIGWKQGKKKAWLWTSSLSRRPVRRNSRKTARGRPRKW